MTNPRLAVEDRPVDGATAGVFGGLEQRLGHAADESLLRRRDAERLDGGTVRSVDRS
jgi:hypothetical protein